MSDHDGDFWISYRWYVFACSVCAVAGFLAGLRAA